MKLMLRFLAAVCPMLALPVFAQTPVDTTFTYQGRLDQAGAPASGSHDLRFRLFDAAEGGAQVGQQICYDNRELVDGLFSVALDFGAEFMGEARWIEIGVRADAGELCFNGAYTTLAPRQPLTAAPYAIHAMNAGQWQNSGNGIMNTNNGFVGINRDFTVGLEWFGVHAPVNSGYGGMYITTEGDTAWPFYGYKAGSQTAWTYLDGGDGDWHINVDGNKVTVTDEGMVGIRTADPAYPLHVVSTNTDRAIHGENSTTTGVGVRGQATAVTGSATGVYGVSNSPAGAGVRGESPNIGVQGSATAAGGVGLHGSGPLRAVVGTSPGTVAAEFTGTGVNSGGVYGASSGTGALAYGVFGEMTNPSANGVGVLGRAPDAGVRGEGTAIGAVGVEGVALGTSGKGVEGRGWLIGVYGSSETTPAGVGIWGENTAASGQTFGVRGVVTSATGYSGYFEGGRNYFEGNVGLGTADPANPLSVVGDADITGRVSIGITGADARLLVRSTVGEDAFRVRVDTATKVVVKDNGGVGIGSNFGTVPANGLRTAGAVGIGADPGAFTLVSNGDAAKPGGGSWSNFSDARLKRNIQPIEPGMLDRLLALRGCTFEYVEDAIEHRLGLPGRQTGMIAQEVQAVLPEWVDADDEGYLYVTERGLSAMVVEALRELRTEKDAAIGALRADNDALRQRLARIEATLAQLAERCTAAD